MLSQSQEVTVFIVLLLLLGVFTLGCVVLVYWRRNVFPLNGRASSLVIALAVSISIPQVWTLSDAFEIPLPCWSRAISGFLEVTAAQLMMFRVLRFWCKLVLSHERLQHLRGRWKRSRKQEVFVQTVATRRWAWLSNTSNIWKIQSFMWLASVGVLIGIQFMDGSCASMVETLSLVNGVACYIVMLTIAWKARRLDDGFFIRKELIYLATEVVLVVLAVAVTHSLPDPKMGIIIAFQHLHILAIICIYPVLKSYGINFHPFLPWTWCCSESSEDACMDGTSRSDLLTILTNEDHKEMREEFEDHLTKEFSIENVLFWDTAGEFLEENIDIGEPVCLVKHTVSSGGCIETNRCLKPSVYQYCQVCSRRVNRIWANVFEKILQSNDLSYDEVARVAVTIFFNFIQEGALNEINISAPIRSRIEQSFSAAITNLEEMAKHRHTTETLFHSSSVSEVVSSINDDVIAIGEDSDRSMESSPAIRAQINPHNRIEYDIFEDARRQVFRMMQEDSFARWQSMQRKRRLSESQHVAF